MKSQHLAWLLLSSLTLLCSCADQYDSLAIEQTESKQATIAGDCFWCAESEFAKLSG